MANRLGSELGFVLAFFAPAIVWASTLWRSPRSGDTVLMGRPLLLQWKSTQSSSATVWYSLDTGRTWHRLITDSPGDAFLWNVPALDTVRLLLRLRLEEGATPAPVQVRREAHQAPIRCVRFSPDGTYLVTTAEDGVVKLWNVATLEATDVLVIGNRSTILASAAFAGDSSRVLIAVDSLLLLYERSTGERIRFGSGVYQRFIRDVAVHPSGLYAATAADDTLLCVWDLKALQPLYCWGEPGVSSWYSVAFSPDGTLLAYGGNDGMLYIRPWQQPWQPARRFGQHGDSMGNRVIWAVSFGTEERLAISAGVDGTVRLWSLQTGQEQARALGHRFHVRSARALPWGRRIVSGSLDSTVRQWTPSGTPLGPVLWHGGQVLSVDYSPTGTLIASAGRDSALRLWESGVERSTDDTIAVFLRYPVRLRLPSLSHRAGESIYLPVLHEDYHWILPLRQDSFACNLVLRLPAWLVERTGQPATSAWDTVRVEMWLRAADTLALLPLRALAGIPSSAPLEILSVAWPHTDAFRAELLSGAVAIQKPCPGAEAELGTAGSLGLQVSISSQLLTLRLYADEDGVYALQLSDSMGRMVWHQRVHLRPGEHVFSLCLNGAAGLYWLMVRSPSREVVQPLWHTP